MVKLTLINRIRDSLPLAEGLDREKDAAMDTCKQQAKVHFVSWYSTCAYIWQLDGPSSSQTIIKQLAKAPHGQPQRVSVESGPYMFHYLVSEGVVYLTLAEKGYPKKLAFQYLEELRKEFTSLYGTQIEGTTRPYAFIRFGICLGIVIAVCVSHPVLCHMVDAPTHTLSPQTRLFSEQKSSTWTQEHSATLIC